MSIMPLLNEVKAGRVVLGSLLVALVALATPSAMAQSNPERGAKAFQVCSACHSLRPGLNMTGPSLAGVWGRKAGSLADFDRYSPALKHSGLTWDAKALDPWLKSPERFIPGNWMTFAGIADAATRADLIAFLRGTGETPNGGPAVEVPSAYTERPNDLKRLSPDQQVTEVRSCRDSYFVTTADGKIHAFWDHSLRLETDAGPFGPTSGTPALLPAGMMGDRANVIFAKPEEISRFIKQQC